ncbi:hypothetical protein OSTOST_26156 [Ostertagia ostertagi]
MSVRCVDLAHTTLIGGFSQIISNRTESDIDQTDSRSASLYASSDRLKHIEQMLQEQSSMLTELLQRNQPSNSRRASVVHSSCRLLELLHAASPALLRGLSACLLQLADGHPSPPHLERILNAICENEGSQQQLESVTTIQGSVVSQVRQVCHENPKITVEGHGAAGGKVRNDLEHLVSSIMHEVMEILEQCDDIDEETDVSCVGRLKKKKQKKNGLGGRDAVCSAAEARFEAISYCC